MSNNIPLLSAPNVPSAVQFDANKEFHTHTEQQDLDSAFLGYRRRPWVQEKISRNTQKERETLMALLATSVKDEYTTDCVNQLIAENISFRDLASLTDKDLEIFGFTSHKHRTELISLFNKMPNQDPSYEYICNLPEAKTYNNQIVSNAANHLMSMRSSLAATNYKLQVMQPEDVIVGDKRYASRFALEALNSVHQITDELTKDLFKLEEMVAKFQHESHLISNSAGASKKKYCSIWTVFYYSAIIIGSVCAWWWSKKNLNG